MAYTKTTWVDGTNVYDIKTQGDVDIETDVKLVYEGSAVPMVNATNLNNMEAGIVSAIRLTIWGMM